MARPKKVIASIKKNLCLPENLVTRVELELYSELEGKVPFGAWQEFISSLIVKYFNEKNQLEKDEENE